jgi:hypothetical protein
VHDLQNQLSVDVDSLLYLLTGKFIHLIWCHIIQSSHCMPRLFFLTGLLQMPQGNFTGPGFDAMSLDSNNKIIKDDLRWNLSITSWFLKVVKFSI